MSDATNDLARRVAALERRLRLAVICATASTGVAAIALAATATSRAVAATPAAPVQDVLRVRQLDVVDGNGITRVKLAAPLPMANGNKTRGGGVQDTVSGMLLFDAEGTERSGYVTVDHGYSNVLLTLDDKRKQHAMFIAEPTGATTLRLFNADTKDRVDVAVDADGPSISMIRRGKEIYRQPAK